MTQSLTNITVPIIIIPTHRNLEFEINIIYYCDQISSFTQESTVPKLSICWPDDSKSSSKRQSNHGIECTTPTKVYHNKSNEWSLDDGTKTAETYNIKYNKQNDSGSG